MKQFTVKDYIEHPEWRVQTRHGKDVRILCYDRRGKNIVGNFCIVALVDEDDCERLITCTSDGKLSVGGYSDYDLFFAPRKITRWVNICKNGAFYNVYGTFPNRKDAENIGRENSDYITTIKLEWEE